MDWLPIETAPRDGTDVLLWLNPHQPKPGGYAVVGYWDRSLLFGDIWRFGDGTADAAVATNWMPLPAPPRKED